MGSIRNDKISNHIITIDDFILVHCNHSNIGRNKMACKIVKILEKELETAQENMKWSIARQAYESRNKFANIAEKCIDALKYHTCCDCKKCKCEGKCND